MIPNSESSEKKSVPSGEMATVFYVDLLLEDHLLSVIPPGEDARYEVGYFTVGGGKPHWYRPEDVAFRICASTADDHPKQRWVEPDAEAWRVGFPSRQGNQLPELNQGQEFRFEEMKHWLWINEPIPSRYYEKGFAGMSLGNDHLNAPFTEAELRLVKYLRSLQYGLRKWRATSELKRTFRPRSALFRFE